MKCVKCGARSCVTLTYQNQNNTVKRRRECLECQHRFTTREIATTEKISVKEAVAASKEHSIDRLHQLWYNPNLDNS